MAKDESSNGWIYLGLGVAAACAAGYLVWRYALDERTKRELRESTTTLLRQSRQMADNATQAAIETSKSAARDAMARVRSGSQ